MDGLESRKSATLKPEGGLISRHSGSDFEPEASTRAAGCRRVNGTQAPWRFGHHARDPPHGRHGEQCWQGHRSPAVWVLVMIGMWMSSRMIQGYSANRPVVSTAERTEGNSRLAPSAARVW